MSISIWCMPFGNVLSIIIVTYLVSYSGCWWWAHSAARMLDSIQDGNPSSGTKRRNIWFSTSSERSSWRGWRQDPSGGGTQCHCNHFLLCRADWWSLPATDWLSLCQSCCLYPQWPVPASQALPPSPSTLVRPGSKAEGRSQLCGGTTHTQSTAWTAGIHLWAEARRTVPLWQVWVTASEWTLHSICAHCEGIQRRHHVLWAKVLCNSFGKEIGRCIRSGGFISYHICVNNMAEGVYRHT